MLYKYPKAENVHSGPSCETKREKKQVLTTQTHIQLQT